ncbi:hypothetical protein PHYBLDRAFT_76341 [Phycomyces blakesleeanus NRRL 1555(-)]|uniref:Ribosomal silencing factor RsfS n=1 Tax=Phycomyces blakesleeanus (strain ATCC 8743b / DSM 1359 / FGSC 10004 / NBRC 33097 / NRRL 1555) TaxID=763407 RepID=A0A162PZ41_PHYB8|nr:hypothetical protein PHYBLDRAFT_76341 [Phycomyces blakesleeanus NRRL 1555(-)]OAD77327.1 hypothetical protein PHYBLDRAFT_76341 [Phycomyces blakesleeanus NRRL 1555(-)]|eukprot:XP_018295367.1 hypothetical protein PHYBLDRAFT_76341 [Phycomyces blakesleeanus NRRL 1555(-)]
MYENEYKNSTLVKSLKRRSRAEQHKVLRFSTMFRLTSLARTIRAPVVAHTLAQPQILRGSTIVLRKFSQTTLAWNQGNPTTPPIVHSEAEDDLEEIDPKDYPELYPTEEETIPTEITGEGVLSDVDDTGMETGEVDTEWFVDAENQDQQGNEEFIPLWQRTAMNGHLQDRWAIQEVSKQLMESGELTAETIQAMLEENRMENVKVLDLREKCDWTDYMIIAESPKGDKFLGSVADHVQQVVRKTIRSHPHQLAAQPTPRIEGRNDQSGWLLIDLGRFVIHLFTPEVRQSYDIEGLWKYVPTDPSLPMPYRD